jgi:nicotinamidase-related amidase
MKKLLIVVDFQNDFVDGSLGFAEAKNLEERISQKIIQYQNEKQDIIFTFDTHDHDYLKRQEGRYLPIEHCIKNTSGWELYGTVADLFKYGIRKIEKNAFGSLDLGNYLVKHPYDAVELVG